MSALTRASARRVLERGRRCRNGHRGRSSGRAVGLNVLGHIRSSRARMACASPTGWRASRTAPSPQLQTGGAFAGTLPPLHERVGSAALRSRRLDRTQARGPRVAPPLLRPPFAETEAATRRGATSSTASCRAAPRSASQAESSAIKGRLRRLPGARTRRRSRPPLLRALEKIAGRGRVGVLRVEHDAIRRNARYRAIEEEKRRKNRMRRRSTPPTSASPSTASRIASARNRMPRSRAPRGTAFMRRTAPRPCARTSRRCSRA